MADELDRAADITAAECEAGVARARAAAQRSGPPHNGFCYACEEEIPSPKIFCDAACAADHARRKRR